MSDRERRSQVAVAIDDATLSPAGRARLADELANLDHDRLVAWFPREPDGRWPLGETVLLAELDLASPPKAHQARYLVATSPAKRSAPQVITLAISVEDARNRTHRWTDARWLWDRRHAKATEEERWGVGELRGEWLRLASPATAQISFGKLADPTPGERAALSIALVRAGEWRDAIALYGVTHELDALPYDRANHTAGIDPARWDAALAAEFATLAPWQLPALARRVDAKTRLFLLPGQTTTRKYGIAIRTVSGAAQLFVALTGSNQRVPALHWKWPPDLAAIIRGDAPLPARGPRKATLEQDLVGQLAAAPADLDLRRVYADVLTERENPRGELITLQLLDAPTKAQRERIEHLAREHGIRWLGPLADLVQSHEFEGGFLSRMFVRVGTARAWEPVLAPAFAHELATIRSLALDLAMPAELARPLLAAGRFPRLDWLSVPTAVAGEVRCATRVLMLRPPHPAEAQHLRDVRLGFDPAPTELVFPFVTTAGMAEAAGIVFRRAMSEALPEPTTRVIVRTGIEIALSRDDRGAFSQLDVQWSASARKQLVRVVAQILAELQTRQLTSVHVGAVLTKRERATLEDLLPAGVLTSDQAE